MHGAPGTLAKTHLQLEKDRPENAQEEEYRMQNSVARSKEFFFIYSVKLG